MSPTQPQPFVATGGLWQRGVLWVRSCQRNGDGIERKGEKGSGEELGDPGSPLRGQVTENSPTNCFHVLPAAVI